MREFVVVKKVITKGFEIEMYKDSKYDEYRIRYETKEGISHSERIKDYSMATYLFDIKLQELKDETNQVSTSP